MKPFSFVHCEVGKTGGVTRLFIHVAICNSLTISQEQLMIGQCLTLQCLTLQWLMIIKSHERAILHYVQFFVAVGQISKTC